MEGKLKSGEDNTNEIGAEARISNKDDNIEIGLGDLLNSNGNIFDNFPVITGYYGTMLRKKRHPLFGSYWSKEYCLVQSNMFVCHKLKYPYCITKCISIASIVKCEISMIDPCVFCITINNEMKIENKEVPKKKNKMSLFCFKRINADNKMLNLKFKCISTLDTQKWINYINNNIKTWKLNKNVTRNLFSGTQYIEKTMAQEVFEKMRKKMRKMAYHSNIQNFINILKVHYLKVLFYSFSRLYLNYILNELKENDGSSTTTYRTNNTSVSDNELLYRNDLLQIKKRILTFKHEQGMNNLNRIINRKKKNYWETFSNKLNNNESIDSNIATDDSYVQVYYNQVKLRKHYYNWKILTKKRSILNNHIELLNSYKLKYEHNNSSLASTDYYPTRSTNSVNKITFFGNNNITSSNYGEYNLNSNSDYNFCHINDPYYPKILKSSIESEEIVSSKITSFTKHQIYCSEENIHHLFDTRNNKELGNIHKTNNERISSTKTQTSYNVISSISTRGILPNKHNYNENDFGISNNSVRKTELNTLRSDLFELTDNSNETMIEESKHKMVQLIKLNQILLKKKRSAWGLLQANIIQNKVLSSIYKYNQILSFIQIADKICKLRLYRAFINIRSIGGKYMFGV